MKIWIDGDSCPRPVKEIIYRACERCSVEGILVANKTMHTPRSEWISLKVVEQGFDIADELIIDEVSPDDIVVTADIPLAAAIVERGAVGVNPRGEEYTPENIRERLSVRDFMEDLRAAGVSTSGPATFGSTNKHRFAATLDRLLNQHKNAVKQASR